MTKRDPFVLGWVLSGLVWLGVVEKVPAETIVYKNYGITVTIPNATPPNGFHGYTEYPFSIRNDSAEAHEVTLIFPDDLGRSRRTHIHEIRRTIRVDAGKTSTVSLFEPFFPTMSGDDIRVEIDGEGQERKLRASFGWSRSSRAAFGGGTTDPRFLVLVSHRADVSLGSAVADFIRKHANRGEVSTAALEEAILARSQVGIREWSEMWLAYTRFDGIVLTADDLADMSAGARAVMWQFVESGGTLLVLGNPELPKTWTPIPVGGQFSDLQQYEAVFGVCLISRQTAIDEKWLIRNWGTFHSAVQATSQPLLQVRSLMEAHYQFPVVESIDVPVRALFIFMLLFAIAIGPLNFSLLNRAKKRIWALWTIPAISLVTCIAVFLFMLIVEGWQGHLRTMTLTVLDQNSKRASTVGWTSFYAPMVPGDGLRFSTHSEVVLQQSGHSYRSSRRRYSRGNKACYIDWSEEQHLSQGWMTPRVPSPFQVRKSEIRNERLAVYRPANGRLSISNLLGAPIQKLWLMDENGQVWAGEAIDAGARATLSLTEGGNAIQKRTLRSFFNVDWFTSFETLRNAPREYLKPKTWIAQVSGSPFFEDGLRNATEKKYDCWVYGILDEIKAE